MQYQGNIVPPLYGNSNYGGAAPAAPVVAASSKPKLSTDEKNKLKTQIYYVQTAIHSLLQQIKFIKHEISSQTHE